MEQFNLNRHTYNDHLKEMMQNLMHSNESTDVTIMCEDKTKFKAHKFVLNAWSPVFQSMISELPQKDPIIYLRGIHSQEIKSILQFMYLGQATFFHDRMNDFLNVAKSLEIKEISKDVDQDVSVSQNDQEYEKNIDPPIDDLHEEKDIVSQSNVEGEIDHISRKVISHRNEAGQFPCNRCSKIYTYRHVLDRHIKSAHEGIKFSCNDCGYEGTQRGSLTRHIQTVHKVSL